MRTRNTNNRNLTKAMAGKRLTQQKLADALKLNQGTVSGYVNGQEPKARRAIEIAKALGTTVEAIWGGAK